MKKWIVVIGAAVLGLCVTVPAHAGWKLVEQAKQVQVAKGALSVTPGEDWNRNTARPIKKSEMWTLDGAVLNELYFVSGLVSGETLFREIDKKQRPLPTLSNTALLTDIPEFYESSSRIVLDTSLFEMGAVEPATFAGHPGIKFEFSYQVQTSPIVRKGLAVGTLINGQLHLITFVAPEIHYFDRDRAKAEAIIASATI